MHCNNPQTLTDWQKFFLTSHNKSIDLGLDRIRQVAFQLRVLDFDCPVIMLTGTNGKGSCATTLERVYIAAGYKVGIFTSPFLLRFNEQVRVNGKEVADQALGGAFTTINQQRQDIPLTAFEFLTLAALKIFKQNELDVIILEVGMGGRRDAVNIIDADVAIITNVAIDHQNWLGATREAIAAEKVGILRKGRPVIFGESNLPQALINKVSTLQTPLFIRGKDFSYRTGKSGFSWQCHTRSYHKLPLPKLTISNVSIALMAIQLLQNQLPVTQDALQNGIVTAKLVGRMHIVSKPIMQIFDVAHNPAAAKFLARNLKKHPCKGKTSAIFSIFKDKDIVNTILPLTKIVDTWYVAPLQHERTASTEQLITELQQASIKNTYKFLTVKDAYLAALANATANDCIIVYGSFRTVAEILI